MLLQLHNIKLKTNKEVKIMEKYIKPSYVKEYADVKDIILASAPITYVGEGTLGDITGNKAQVSMNYAEIFDNK